MGKCPHGLGENRGGRVGGGAENVHRGCPTGPQEVVLGFQVFEGQVVTRPGGHWLVWSWSALSTRPRVLVESFGSLHPEQQKCMCLLQGCSLSSPGLRSTAHLPDKPGGMGQMPPAFGLETKQKGRTLSTLLSKPS